MASERRRWRLLLTLLTAALCAAPVGEGSLGAASDATHASAQRAGARAGERLHGLASYYSGKLVGRRTASGEVYDGRKMTAAHRSLPLGTRVRVVAPESGRAVVVRVNDRGPYVPGRTIDLSRRAGQVLGITQAGVVPVTIEVLSTPASGDAETRAS